MAGQNIEIVKLQVRRGPEAQLPTLDVGEPAVTTDTHKFFIGDGYTNHQLANQTDLVNLQTAPILQNSYTIALASITVGNIVMPPPYVLCTLGTVTLA